MELDLFACKIGMYTNVNMAQKYTPIVDEYLEKSSSMMDIDNHITTYHNPTLGEELNSDERLFPLFNWCIQTALHYFDERGYDTDKFDIHPHFFVNHIKKGSFFHRHAHPNAKISGVFYLDASPDSAGIIFHDPRPYKQCIALPMKNNCKETDEITLPVSTGQLLIWNSWLEHEVPQNKSNNPRKTLVFNL